MSQTPNNPNPDDQPDADSETQHLSQEYSGNDSGPTQVWDDSSASDDSKTQLYDSSEPDSARSSDSKSGSSGKTPPSDERVRRDWDAALGSSGKGSGESIRFERQEASDSVLERIAVRKVADANIGKSERANFDYAIQDKLGEGGMGIVFSATQTAVNRVVALKTLKKDKNNDPATQKQFFYEAEITADLDHPNIPPIYELGMTEQGTFFYTMKLIKGSEWHRAMTKRSQEDNLAIFDKLADAVGFAHSKKIINLDIKPQNVILGGYGEVYVTDWGMAHDLEKGTPPSLGGTPDYMPPEIPRKAFDRIGPQTDIYLLGAVLFQILTGKPPHAGVETKDRKKAGQSKVLDAYHNRIRPADSDSPLLQVALKAMSTDPADRYATVEDMKGAVDEIVRENRNINASIEMVQTSKTTLQLAEKSQDYERFNRAIFGFQNAVELWTGNKEAEEQLATARLAFGKCAVAKGDFDLALQTLDRKVPDEATLFDKAQKAKTAVLNRESRFKLLRNLFAGVTATFLLVTAGLALNAYFATAGKLKAEQDKLVEEEGRRRAETDRATALQENIDLEKKRQAEKEAAAKTIADTEQKQRLAENKASEEKLLRLSEEKNNQEKLTIAANERANIERKAKEAAQLAAAKIQINQQLTNLGFASAQADKANPIGAATLLDLAQTVDEATKQAFGEKPVPELENWASRRIELLSNRKLPRQELNGQVTAIDFAKGRNRGVAGMSDGRVVALELRDGKLVERSSKRVDGNQPIVGASISPTGDEAMLAVGAKLYRWVLDGDLEPMQEEVTKNRSFQGFAYSPDGSMVVAGIRGGVYIKKSGTDWQELTPNVKGSLLDADWLGDRGVLVLADNDGDRNLHFVPVASDAMPAVLERGSKFTQIGVLDASAGKIVIASDGGALTTYDFDASSNTLSNPQALTRQHGSDVTQIDIDPSAQRMVTGSGEAVVHVWKYLPTSREVVYETFLTGTPGASEENVIARTAMIDGMHVVNVDKAGSAVALDIDRQKQRRELTREGDYERVVIGLHPRGDSSQMLSVDENGAVDQWDLVTGQTVNMTTSNDTVAASRYSYFGHTPGAVLFDTAVDLQSGVVVTSAVLPTGAMGYLQHLSSQGKTWAEFCVWDQATGNMLRRWQSEMSNPAEPRLTLLEGKAFFVGNLGRAIVFDYSGNEPFRNEENQNGATFAVVNPVNPDQVAMLRQSGGKGSGWLWSRGTANPWIAKGSLFELPSMPVHAAWSEDGKRLYVLDMAGGITPMGLTDQGDMKKGVDPNGRTGRMELKGPGVLAALRSYQAVEFVARRDSNVDVVVCNIRDASTQKTTTFTCNYQVLEKGLVAATAPTVKTVDGLKWLDDLPNYSIQIRPESGVLSKRRSGNQMLVSMKNGRVYGVGEPIGNPILYGRQKFVMSTSDRDGNRLIGLYADGSILELAIQPTGSEWKRLGYKLEPDEKRISLSPDGKRLAVYDAVQKRIRVLAVDSGAEEPAKREGIKLEGIVEFAWDPEQDAGLAVLNADGVLGIETDGPVQPIANLADNLGAMQPNQLAFFQEKWSDPAQKPARHIVIYAEDKVLFVSRQEEPRVFEKVVGKGMQIAVSPKDSILATGNAEGTVRIWFASPGNEICQQVYDLAREEKSEVKRIAFSGDGDTLITSDVKKRVSAWMSQDKLSPGP